MRQHKKGGRMEEGGERCRRARSFWSEAQRGAGFTLVETLVAVAVLLIAIAGPFTIAAQSLQTAYYARDQVAAFYLAQEGIEYIRAVRDQNFLRGNDWMSGIDNCIGASCVIDFPHFSHQVCSGQCPRVLVHHTSGLFNQDSGSPSLYRRVLTITPVPGTSDEVVVSVSVSWQTGGRVREFSLEGHLFRWL